MKLAKLISVTKPTIEVDGRTLTPEEFIVYCAAGSTICRFDWSIAPRRNIGALPWIAIKP
jgi:hypothetical protein